jgi:hypothetical protein
MEDIDKDDYVIEYVGRIECKRRENNYMMKINGINLWINGNKKWWTCLIHESLMQSKL